MDSRHYIFLLTVRRSDSGSEVTGVKLIGQDTFKETDFTKTSEGPVFNTDRRYDLTML